MAQHTPGRWSRNIPPARKYCIVFAGRNTHVASICSSPSQSDAEIEANCNLIVAAPAMADAIRAAAQAAAVGTDADGGFAHIPRALFDALENALDAATGEYSKETA